MSDPEGGMPQLLPAQTLFSDEDPSEKGNPYLRAKEMARNLQSLYHNIYQHAKPEMQEFLRAGSNTDKLEAFRERTKHRKVGYNNVLKGRANPLRFSENLSLQEAQDYLENHPEGKRLAARRPEGKRHFFDREMSDKDRIALYEEINSTENKHSPRRALASFIPYFGLFLTADDLVSDVSNLVRYGMDGELAKEFALDLLGFVPGLTISKQIPGALKTTQVRKIADLRVPTHVVKTVGNTYSLGESISEERESER